MNSSGPLRQVVAGIEQAVVDQSCGVRLVLRQGPGGRHRVVLTVEHDRRDRDRGLLGDPALGLVVRRIAVDQAVAMPVGVDGDLDEVEVVERRPGSSAQADPGSTRGSTPSHPKQMPSALTCGGRSWLMPHRWIPTQDVRVGLRADVETLADSEREGLLHR